jgi:hypothetical protein
MRPMSFQSLASARFCGAVPGRLAGEVNAFCAEYLHGRPQVFDLRLGIRDSA